MIAKNGTSKNNRESSLNRNTLVSQVYGYLREQILRWDLPPGSKIDVNGVARMLGVSPTPVREALHKLAQHGLVEPKPYVGYFVVQLTQTDVEEIFDLRIVLEVYALKVGFQRIRRADVEELLNRLRKLELEGVSREDFAEKADQFDSDLHWRLIVRAGNNRWLTEIMGKISDLIVLTRRLVFDPEAFFQDHKEILEALRDGDLDGAISALTKHLLRSKSDAIAAMTRGRKPRTHAKGRGKGA